MERFAFTTLGKVRDLAGGFSTDSGKHCLLVTLELFFYCLLTASNEFDKSRDVLQTSHARSTY